MHSTQVTLGIFCPAKRGLWKNYRQISHIFSECCRPICCTPFYL